MFVPCRSLTVNVCYAVRSTTYIASVAQQEMDGNNVVHDSANISAVTSTLLIRFVKARKSNSLGDQIRSTIGETSRKR